MLECTVQCLNDDRTVYERISKSMHESKSLSSCAPSFGEGFMNVFFVCRVRECAPVPSAVAALQLPLNYTPYYTPYLMVLKLSVYKSFALFFTLF